MLSLANTVCGQLLQRFCTCIWRRVFRSQLRSGCRFHFTYRNLTTTTKNASNPNDSAVSQTNTQNAFYKYVSLKSTTLPKSTRIDNCAFSVCLSLKTITLPPSLTTMGVRVFYRCSSLKTIDLQPSLTTMGVFYNCSLPETMIMPSSLTTMVNYVFHGCSSLKTITLPPSLKTMGNRVFRESS